MKPAPAPALALLLLGLAAAGAAAAELARPVLIGVLTQAWGPPPGAVGLSDGLVELGYRENRDFVVGVHFTQGDYAKLPAAAGELIQVGSDLLFTIGEAPTQAAQRTTADLPIVFVNVGDPLGLGLIDAFARPGGNTTGVADLIAELDAKRLQLFKEIVPGLQKVLFPYSGSNQFQAAREAELLAAAERLGIVVVARKLDTLAQARDFFAGVVKQQFDGIMSPGTVELNIPGFVLELTARQGIPTMFASQFYVELGGLASYGTSYYDSGRQAARLVDKIINGADPGDIPVEVNRYFEFAVNLQVAQRAGVVISAEVLFQADRVVQKTDWAPPGQRRDP